MEMIPTGLPDLSKPSRTQKTPQKMQKLGKKLEFLEMSTGLRRLKKLSDKKFSGPKILLMISSKNYSFSLDFLVLEGCKSSGRPGGKISTNFRPKRSGGFRAMTKNPNKKMFGGNSP